MTFWMIIAIIMMNPAEIRYQMNRITGAGIVCWIDITFRKPINQK
jgi:hypothetical protein